LTGPLLIRHVHSDDTLVKYDIMWDFGIYHIILLDYRYVATISTVSINHNDNDNIVIIMVCYDSNNSNKQTHKQGGDCFFNNNIK